MARKRTIIDRLNDGEVIIGDGGMLKCLEKRGFVTPGVYTPEAVIDYPHAVRELHREFALSGADVLQAFVFNGTDDNLNQHRPKDQHLSCEKVNKAACDIAKEIADQFGCLIAGSVSKTVSYIETRSKEAVQREVENQIRAFINKDIDFMVAEFIECIEEAEWIVEIMKTKDLPIAASLCIGLHGDGNGVNLKECAVRLAKTGADIIGLNCLYSPVAALKAIKILKEALKEEGLSSHIMIQPSGYRTDDLENHPIIVAPECPLAVESRTITRWDVHKYAREAYDAGVRYIGGCCGFESYHIRAIAEELHQEKGKLPINSRGLYGESLEKHYRPDIRNRSTKEYWFNVVPTTGFK